MAGTAVAMVLVSGDAFACGACADATIVRAAFWTRVIHGALAALVLDAIMFSAYLWRTGAGSPVQYGSLFMRVFVALCVALFAGAIAASTLLVALMGAKWLRWIVREHRSADTIVRRVAMKRLAVVPLALVLTVVFVRPGAYSTQQLASLAVTGGLISAEPAVPANWVEHELLTRVDASSTLEVMLRERAPMYSPLSPGTRRLLKLHAAAGGAESFRLSLCASSGSDAEVSQCAESAAAR